MGFGDLVCNILSKRLNPSQPFVHIGTHIAIVKGVLQTFNGYDVVTKEWLSQGFPPVS